MNLSKQQFWTGIIILLNNYHAINRKLSACFITKVEKVIENLKHVKLNCTEQHEPGKEDLNIAVFKALLSQMSKDGNTIKNIEGFVVHFKCVPKKHGDTIIATGLIDLFNYSFRMIFANDAMVDFEIKNLDGELIADVFSKNPEFDIDFNLRWRDYVLKPKFYKWCLSDHYNSESKFDDTNKNTSMRLVDIEKYNRLYNYFKQKYSETALKFWNDAKESTDPLKYIYEDLAISAYLITLWQSDLVNEPPTAFADLGCGNGLLVYILIQEGYKGYGYDVRSRKIWSLYPVQVTSQLYEQTVEPYKFTFPAEVNWLIGNHSDELSPWLPVLAAICHENVNFFLLPCCAFEFSGNKFQRRNSSISGYMDFCDYVVQISNICGFKTRKDRLKIPSTKRNALIGITPMNSDVDFSAKIEHINHFVRMEQLQHPNSSSEKIKLRNKAEAVRNCTQIEKSVIETLVKEIFFLLLAEGINCPDREPHECKWQTGGRLTMAQIAKSLDRTKLKKIKSECGGLKTLLRNKHEIFQFEQAEFVSIRTPQLQFNKTSKPQTIKKRSCFFKLHHPQGCPLKDEECTFLH